MNNHFIQKQKSMQEKINKLTDENSKNFNEAFYLMNSGEIKENKTDYLLKIKKNPNYWLEFEHNTASELDAKKAVKLLSDIIEKDHQNEQAYILRAIAYFELQLYKESSSDYEACINLNLETPSYYALNGVGMMKLMLHNDTSSAINIFTRVIELNPKMINPYFNRAYAYSIENRWQKAYNDLVIFLENKPNEKMALELKDKAEKTIVKIKTLIQEISDDISRNQDDRNLYMRRSILYKNLDEIGKMHSDVDKARKTYAHTITKPNKSLGYSISNPFDVSTVPDVYAILEKHFPDYNVQKQSLQYFDNQKYDVVEITNNSDLKKTIYFRYLLNMI